MLSGAASSAHACDQPPSASNAKSAAAPARATPNRQSGGDRRTQGAAISIGMQELIAHCATTVNGAALRCAQFDKDETIDRQGPTDEFRPRPTPRFESSQTAGGAGKAAAVLTGRGVIGGGATG